MGKVRDVLRKVHTACKKVNLSENQQLQEVESLITEHVTEDIVEDVIENVDENIDGVKTETSANNTTVISFSIPTEDYGTYDKNIDEILGNTLDNPEEQIKDISENESQGDVYVKLYLDIPAGDVEGLISSLEEIGAVDVQPKTSSISKTNLSENAIKYAVYGYNRGELDREYVYDTLEEAQQKFNNIKEEGVYSYFWGDVDSVKLVKIKSTDEYDTVLKVFDEVADD